MDKLSAIASLVCISLYGLLTIYRRSRIISEKHNFAIKFLTKLQEYTNSEGQDLIAYSYLLNRSNRMQNDMGSQGILSNYRPPYQNFMFKNYPIILNMIPELRAAFDDILLSKLAGQYSSALQESIVRHIGSIEDFLDRQRGELKNPIIWTREGVRSLAGIPANFLGWIGLISSSTAWRINSSLIFKIFSGALSLIGFVSAIITIALGWDQFLTLIDSIIKKII